MEREREREKSLLLAQLDGDDDKGIHKRKYGI